MSEYLYAGLTSQTLDVKLYNTSTGAPYTGLVFNTSGLKAYYRKGATGSATAITLATQTVGGAWSSGGFVEIDATNMAGIYRLDVPNAMVDTEGFVTLHIYGTNIDITQRVDCRPLPVDVKKVGGTSQTAGDLAALLATLAGYVDTEVAAIKAKTDNLPSDPADASDIASSFSTVNSTLATIAAYIDTEVAAIKAKTDNLPADPADASDIASSFSTVNSTLATIAGYLDTEIAAIKAKTDNLPSDPADQSAVEAAIATAVSTLATAANQTIIIDGIGYLLAQDTGAVSSPQTSTPAYATSFNGSTYTVTHTGVTSTGVRGTATRAKS